MDQTLHAAEQMTDQLLQTLRLARAIAGAHRAITLEGLADQVGLVCAKAMDLAPDDGRQLRPRLIVLLAELDAIASVLHAQAPRAPRGEPCRPGAL